MTLTRSIPFRPGRLVAALLAVLCLLSSALANADRDLARILRRSEKIANSIKDVQDDESSKIPAEIMRQAKGVIIIKEYEAGVIFGAKGGFGIAMKKQDDGSWGPPAWIKTGEISGGIQLGLQKLNVILLIMHEDGLRMLDKPRFKIGVDATVTRGPTGSTLQADIGPKADLLAYTDTEGYYAGATFEGGVLLPDRKSNEITYGERLDVSQIVGNLELARPDFISPIVELLAGIAQPESAAQTAALP